MKIRGPEKGKTSICSVYSPILIVSTFASICTVGIDHFKERLVFSYTRFAFSCFLTVVSITHLCFIPYFIVAIEESHLKQILPINDTLAKDIVGTESTSEHFISKLANPAVVSVTAILARVLTLVQMRRYLPDIVSTLQNVDNILCLPASSARRDVVAFRIMIPVLLGVSFPFQWTSIFTFANGLIVYLCLFLFNNYNNFCMTVCELQFVALCRIIMTRFQYVNKQLLAMDFHGKRRNNDSRVVAKNTKHKIGHHFFEWNHHSSDNQKIRSITNVKQSSDHRNVNVNKGVDLLTPPGYVTNSFNNSDDLLDTNIAFFSNFSRNLLTEKAAFAKKHNAITATENTAPVIDNSDADAIVKLKHAYRYLCDACEAVNAAYNFQLLLSLGGSTVNVMLNIYFGMFGGFQKTANRNKEASQSFGDTLNSTIWSSYYFLRFVFVVIFAAFTAKEANETKVLVLNLLQRDLDATVKNEIWVFITNTIIRDVKFKACGIFTLNLSLIFAAVTTCTTYLVIMAQFHDN